MKTLIKKLCQWFIGLFKRAITPKEILSLWWNRKQEEGALLKAVQKSKPADPPVKNDRGRAVFYSGSKKRMAQRGYEGEKQIGFGTFTRLKHIGGRPIRPSWKSKIWRGK